MAAPDRALWQGIIQHVIDHGGNLIRPWFMQLEPIALEHGLLEIEVPGPREQEYCNKHCVRLFTEAAQRATGRLVGVCFLTRSEAATAERSQTSAPPAYGSDRDHAASLELPEDYTFDTFVTGQCNRLAHAAALAVSEDPGGAYNPLYVHGSVGLGKTHLLYAVCARVAHSAPGARICFLSCETFVNHFIDAVSSGDLGQFRYRYRNADLLVIDDIQFLADHEQSQEEFFHTFNTLYQSRKQIILSSDRSPDLIGNLEDRLVSRFSSGLVARVDAPAYETRVAIIKKKAALRNVVLPEDVANFIAAAITSNTRELEGAIAKVAMLAQVTDRPIDLTLAEEALGVAPRADRDLVTIEDILKAVTTRYRVRLTDLQSKRRSRSIVLPRQICMYLARALTGHSLEEIGGYFGGRDHSTVLHASRTIEARRKEDPQFHAALDLLCQELRGGK